MDASLDENGTGSSSSANRSKNLVMNLEAESLAETSKSRKMYIFMAILVLLVPILAAHLFHKKLAAFRPVES